ncbi:hypothetical protein HYDPIDRAFT_29354 [Hydnomerulius pinastri MD-312]|uniref:Uncharacterized protein n=1 Tax=Hydnomerulius pinastri MD-312 TaxID=994086 RepID=A0A0C9VDC8_9AGAM|nr:hypothetical protein HYDPIDRAFT_29354 [Hydnomerulius pinastri MD-312]
MASLYRPVAHALLDATPRRVAAASFSRSAAALSSATLSAEQSDGLTIPKIFDIFDAPVRLGESSRQLGRSQTVASAARAEPQSSGSMSRNIYSEAMESPWTLPPPITFDGPARPAHLSPSALERRRRLRQNLPLSARRTLGPSSVSFAAFTSQSDPLHEVFDGPSRITRYKYPSSSTEGTSYTYICFALCISSAFGWLALKDQLDSHQQNNSGSA